MNEVTTMELQPLLEDEMILLRPLKESDFEALFAVASDPKIWEQHPNKDRYKRAVFTVFFEGAIASGGAFAIVDKCTGEIIGSTRFYDENGAERSVFIGYTFFARSYWGKGYNFRVKTLMFNYALQFVDTIFLHIGAENIRSQKSIEKVGAKKLREEWVNYYGEASKLNFLYMIGRNLAKEEIEKQGVH